MQITNEVRAPENPAPTAERPTAAFRNWPAGISFDGVEPVPADAQGPKSMLGGLFPFQRAMVAHLLRMKGQDDVV